MKIQNIEGYSAARLQEEADRGARFVFYSYTVSLLVVTLRRNTSVYMIKPGSGRKPQAWFCILVSALLGWWGIPNGPRDTIRAIRKNLKGGEDVTDEVMATVAGHILFQESQRSSKATA
ncbi:MAG: hypothetical protein ACO25B_12355 [Chitinophagaceae bacterium]